MHALQPKHIKLKPEEAKKILEKFNISVSQLAKIKNDDPAIASMNCVSGNVLKIERKEDDKINTYFRVVV
jgi:DNA-directed RNA polymerase subunit H (RpoH/RPB5)